MYGELKNDGFWFSTNPTEEGDYLWVELWDCGCVHRSGIAHVYHDDSPDEDVYWLDRERGLAVSWEGQPPFWFDGKPCVDWWKKIELPPAPE